MRNVEWLRNWEMNRAKIAILLSIVLIVAVVTVSLLANLRGRKVSDDGESLPKILTIGAESALEKIRLVEDKHGKKTWELEAISIRQYQDKNMMLLEDVKLTVYAKDGRSFVVSGKEGKVYQDSKDMELSGNVMLTSSDGYQLRTHSVAYRHEDRRVTSSDVVELEGEQISLRGKGMLVDTERQTFKILSAVKTQLRVAKRG